VYFSSSNVFHVAVLKGDCNESEFMFSFYKAMQHSKEIMSAKALAALVIF